MNDAGAAQQAHRFGGIAQCQEVHRGARECASLTFHILHLLQLGAAAAACVSAVEQGAADRTVTSGFEIEKQIAEPGFPN